MRDEGQEKAGWSFKSINVGDIVSFEEEDYIVQLVDVDKGIVRVEKDSDPVGYIVRIDGEDRFVNLEEKGKDKGIEWQGAWVDACLNGGRMGVRWDRGRWP